MIDQGSYKYGTTIKADVVDRDVAVMIPLNIQVKSDPREIKGYLKDAINIPSRTVTIKEPCIEHLTKKWQRMASYRLPLYAGMEHLYI
jgi:hypothetical protein